MEASQRPAQPGPLCPPPPFGQPPGGFPPEMPEQDVSHMRRKRLDIPYGSAHPRQVFDIYYPETGEGPWPVLLHFHGGGFAIGDKRDFHIRELLDCTKHGYAFACCNYRRSGDAPFPAAVLDCRAFVRHLKSRAGELNILPDKMCAFGGSAGGNLSALFAMNIPRFPGEQEASDVSVACAVDWFGPMDFAAMDAQARQNGVSLADHDEPHSPESRYIGLPLREAPPALLAAANPATYINDKMAPLLIEHGRLDLLVPFGQSETLARAIEEKLGAGRALFLPLDTAGHDDPQFKSPENMAILWAFLDEHLRGVKPAVALAQMPRPRAGAVPGFPEPPALSRRILDAIPRKFLDVPYAALSPSQKLDVYLPEGGETPYPVVIHFHGGAFMICGKRDDSVEPMLRARERGYAVVSAEYRKSGEAVYPAMVHDAKAVLRWVRAHAEEYGFDPRRIALWGPSSGGWLSSFVGVTGNDPRYEGGLGNAAFAGPVQAVVDWCGPCGGFLEMDKAFQVSGKGVPDHSAPQSPESLFLGVPIAEAPALVAEADPRSHIRADVPPFCIVHGDADQVVPVEQSESFFAALESAAPGRSELHVVPGKRHHGDPWYHEPWVSELCLDFLDRVLKGQTSRASR